MHNSHNGKQLHEAGMWLIQAIVEIEILIFPFE